MPAVAGIMGSDQVAVPPVPSSTIRSRRLKYDPPRESRRLIARGDWRCTHGPFPPQHGRGGRLEPAHHLDDRLFGLLTGPNRRDEDDALV